MAYLTLFAQCGGCNIPFTSNPHLVPSARVNGDQLVFCRSCVEAANPIRIAKGLEPIPVLPGAYDAAPELGDEEMFAVLEVTP